MSNREAAAASERPLFVSQAWARVRSEAQATARYHAFDDLYAAVEAYADARVAAASAPQAVRMLTEEEMQAAWAPFSVWGRRESVEACIRKFCEVNGIVPLSPQDTPKEGGK